MATQLTYPVEHAIVQLSGACFWFWNSFHSFLDSSGVPNEIYMRYPQSAYSKYDVMRNVLSDLRRTGRTAAINNLISNFFRLQNAVDRDQLDNEKAKHLLQEFRQLVGNDPIEQEMNKQDRQKQRAEAKNRVEAHQAAERQLAALNSRFSDLSKSSDDTPQSRGYELEKLFYELLQFSELEFSPSYRGHGEQIDGHFKYAGFDYLLEIKWTRATADQADLSVFDGKIRGKAQSTRGLFLSMTGFNPNAISRFSGDSPRIVLMDARDLILILNGNTSLKDVMKAKVDALVRLGRIHHSLSD